MNKITAFFAKMTPTQKKVVIAISGLVVGILLVFFLGRAVTSKAAIAGTLQFSALRPDPEDEGTVTILYRPYNSTDSFQPTGLEVALLDGASWEWEGAKTGKTYELVPQLEIRGRVVGTAEPVVVTAPAHNVQLKLRVTWSDLPAEIVAQQTTNLGGSASVQGVIPPNATLQILARLATVSTYQTVQTLDAVGTTNTWLWTDARPLATYKVKAVLMDGTTQVGESDEVSAEAGEKEVELSVVSGARLPEPTNPSPTPTPSGTIFGKVYINGPKAANSSLVMLFKTPGADQFREIGRIQNPNHGGQEWRFNATAGTTYEIRAVLQVNGKDSATSRSQIVVAPAQGINFTINTGVTIPTPSAEPVLESCGRAPDNRWDATIRFPRVENAGNYWVQIGTSQGASNVINDVRPADNNIAQQLATIRIDGGRHYYAQYAFSFCITCSGSENFSNFSRSLRFSCDTEPTPTPEADWTGYICNKGNNSCELTRDANPPFAFNNAGLEQCQRSCAPTPPPTSTPTPSPTVYPSAVTLPGQL